MTPKTPNWDEVKETRTTASGETYTVYTDRAWDERVAYAVRRLEEMGEEGLPLNGHTKKPAPSRGRRLTMAERVEKFRGVVMVRLSDGKEEPLVTPSDFAKRHGMSTQDLAEYFRYPKRKAVKGWSAKDRLG